MPQDMTLRSSQILFNYLSEFSPPLPPPKGSSRLPPWTIEQYNPSHFPLEASRRNKLCILLYGLPYGRIVLEHKGFEEEHQKYMRRDKAYSLEELLTMQKKKQKRGVHFTTYLNFVPNHALGVASFGRICTLFALTAYELSACLDCRFLSYLRNTSKRHNS